MVFKAMNPKPRHIRCTLPPTLNPKCSKMLPAEPCAMPSSASMANFTTVPLHVADGVECNSGQAELGDR